jgi:hypothetical protein
MKEPRLNKYPRSMNSFLATVFCSPPLRSSSKLSNVDAAFSFSTSTAPLLDIFLPLFFSLSLAMVE